MTVYSPGTVVLVGYQNDPITALVLGVWLEECGAVSYKCAWWDDRVRRNEWISAKEVIGVSPKHHSNDDECGLRIGFK